VPCLVVLVRAVCHPCPQREGVAVTCGYSTLHSRGHMPTASVPIRRGGADAAQVPQCDTVHVAFLLLQVQGPLLEGS
jgi:hypothetical protein